MPITERGRWASTALDERGGKIVGSLTETGQKVTGISGGGSASGSATLQGVGTISASGQMSALGSATLQGVGTVTANPLASRTGAAPLQGVGTYAASGNILGSISGSATLQGVGRLKVSNPKSVIDNFNRADSTTALGTSDSGHTWTTVGGTWGISGNAAYSVSGANNSFAYTDSGLRDVMMTMHISVADSNAIYFRVTDASNWVRAAVRSGTTYLEKSVAGSISLITSHAGGTSGDTIKVYVANDAIDVHVNKYPVIHAIDSFNVNATKQGFGTSAATAAGRNNFFSVESGGFYDNFDRVSASGLGNPSSFMSWQYAGGGTWAISNSATIDAQTSTAYVTSNWDGAMAFSPSPSPDGTILSNIWVYGYTQSNDVSSPQIIFRMNDVNNYLVAYWWFDGIYFSKYDGGVETQLYNYTMVPVVTEHIRRRMTIFMDGPKIDIYLDDESAFGYTLSAAEQLKYGGASQVGMRLFTYVNTTVTPALWDNFAMFPKAAVPIESSGTATLQGVGTIAANGSIIGIQGASSMQGVGVFVASGTASRTGSATLQGVGTMAATIAGAGNLSATMQGVGTITATGNSGSGAFLVAVGTFTATPTIRNDGSVSFTGVGTFTAAGAVGTTGALQGVGTFTAGGTASRVGASTLQGVGTFSATIAGAQNGAASMIAVAIMLAQGAAGLPNVDKVTLLGERLMIVSLSGEKALTATLQGERNITAGVQGSKPPPVALRGEI